MYQNETTPEVERESIKSVADVQEKVLAHLSSKYNKKFQCLAYEDISFLKKYYTFIVSEVGDTASSNEFKAFYYPDEDDKFKDAYYGLILRNLISQELVSSSVIDDTNFKSFVRFIDTSFSEALNVDSSLEDAVQSEGSIDTMIYLFGVKTANVSLLTDKLKQLGITGILCFYEVDEKTFSALTYDTYQDVISDIISKDIIVKSESKTYIK